MNHERGNNEEKVYKNRRDKHKCKEVIHSLAIFFLCADRFSYIHVLGLISVNRLDTETKQNQRAQRSTDIPEEALACAFRLFFALRHDSIIKRSSSL